MVREGEVTSRELVEASLARIEATQALNHWTLLDSENALAAADAIEPGDERPFAGVPFAIKDLFMPVAGLRMAQGSDLVGDYTPDHDGALTRRFKDAGFVIVGKTQTPEFGILPVTEPRRFGPARNPWDPERTTGGSSGGAAGAVAAGTVPVAHASDGGGSIRIPAACCGLVGPEAEPRTGLTGARPGRELPGAERRGGPHHRGRRGDARPDGRAPRPATRRGRHRLRSPFSATAARDPGKLRIALTFDMPIEGDLDPQAAKAARDAAALLEELGHDVAEVAAPWKDADLLPIFSVLWSAMVATSVLHAQSVAGREVTEDDVEPLTWWLCQEGMAHKAPLFVAATAGLQAFARADRAFLGRLRPRAHPGAGQASRSPRGDRPHGREPCVRVQEVGRVHALHGRVQRDRPAGGLSPSVPGGRRPATGHPARGRATRRGPAACGLRPARGGAAVGRPNPRGSRRTGAVNGMSMLRWRSCAEPPSCCCSSPSPQRSGTSYAGQTTLQQRIGGGDTSPGVPVSRHETRGGAPRAAGAPGLAGGRPGAPPGVAALLRPAV